MKQENTIEQLNAQLGKLPPQAVDIEKAVLGALMLESDLFPEVSEILTDLSFYREEHRIIFNSIELLYKDGKTIDLLTITQYLKDNGKLDVVGGAYYLTECVSNVSLASNIIQHSRIIQQKFMQRELIRVCNETLSKAYDDSEDIIDLLSFALKNIENIDKNITSFGKEYRQVVSETFEEIEEDCVKFQKNESSGIPTPIYELTTAIGGWKAPYYTVMGARPGVGKTTIALTIGTHAAKYGFWVNIYTYEMLASSLCKINIAAESGANRTRIRDGRMLEDDWEKINGVVDNIIDYPIIIYDNPDIKASQIKTQTHKNKLKGKCDLVIIDYIQLIPPDSKNMSREQQISEISRTLKKITTGLKVPVIVLAQLNRDVEKRNDPETFNSDFRESGSLEQDADITLLPYNILNDNDEIVQRILKVGKNRNGKVGKFEYFADEQMTHIFDNVTNLSNYTDIAYYNSDLLPDTNPFLE